MPDPKPGTVGNVLEAAWDFARDSAEREAYLEYLRRMGASEEYIQAVEDIWAARDAVREGADSVWDDFVNWVKALFGKGEGRSG